MEGSNSLVKEEKEADENSIDELVSVLKIASLSPVSTCGNTNKEFKVVDSMTEAKEIIKKLHTFDSVTLDCEGVDLGRTGQLTVLAISTTEHNALAFVFDILVLGREIFYGMDQKETLKTLLENPLITKVTFDCRADSDALYHQFQVKLEGCLDLQVFHQGIEREKNIYRATDYRGRPAFVKGCKILATTYCSATLVRDYTVDAPHKSDYNIWKKRPLTSTQWSYSAFDVLLINSMYEKMATLVSPAMLERIRIGSKRYESVFRDYPHDVNSNFQRHKNFIMSEVSI